MKNNKPGEQQACTNPIEDQRQSALKHYKEASDAIRHWNGFVEAAIQSYNPNSKSVKNADEAVLIRLLSEILIDPYGCPMCDSGQLRNPEKQHWPECLFYQAEKLIANWQMSQPPSAPVENEGISLKDQATAIKWWREYYGESFPYKFYEWMAASQPFAPAENESDMALYETRIALMTLMRVFKKIEKTPEQQKYFDSADYILKKYFDPLEVLRSSSPLSAGERKEVPISKISNSVMLHDAAKDYSKGGTIAYNGFEAGVNWLIQYLASQSKPSEQESADDKNMQS